jgi:YVTN family beta-propeller protein
MIAETRQEEFQRMRAFNTLKWSALPLALSLVGCSLLGGADVKGTPASLLAYISMQSLDKVGVVSLIQRTPEGEAIPAGSAPANMVLNPRSDREYLYVTNHSTNTVSFLNVRTRQNEVAVLSGANPWDVAITPNGRFLYVSNTGDATVAMIDVENRSRVKTFSFPSYAGFKPRGVATYMPDPLGTATPKQDAYVVSEANHGTSSAPVGMVIPMSGETTGTPITINGARQLWKAAVTADGTSLLVTDRGDSRLWVVNISSGVVTSITLPAPAWDVVVSPNRNKAAVFVSMPDYENGKGGVASIDLAANSVGKAYATVPVGGQTKARQPQALALNSQGSELWVAVAGSNEVLIFPYLDGTNFSEMSGPRLVTYSYTPGQTGAPEDIVLGRGVQ